ncbi:uncharacterized protein LOC106158650 [Lingula anatina]|uniref:Uncharacterized protein LOC106158650 n=1 Tax=Lingula anatina TaxID=7574 RepID=A0A1S3HVY3_LINAN|nr:uncharacterized protein LOC106158650 [Lingula anatina]|eukprot:XP_013390178.1 uncharacterized protein LOC106158650 [Lingula anatina]
MACLPVTIVIVALSAALVIKHAQAVCCHTVNDVFCGDCSETYTYCGVGWCNLFGCACQGGCKSGCADIKVVVSGGWFPSSTCECLNKRSLARPLSKHVVNPRDVFRNIDIDGDNHISKDEFLDAVVKFHGAKRSALNFDEEFVKMDLNGDNLIDFDEFDGGY